MPKRKKHRNMKKSNKWYQKENEMKVNFFHFVVKEKEKNLFHEGKKIDLPLKVMNLVSPPCPFEALAYNS
jgi:hypothetical protein